MLKKNCQNTSRKLLRLSIFLASLSIFFFGLANTKIFAAGNDTISFQGKIVRNDTGYEGLNVTSGNPSCVVSGSDNDTCDFRILYYDGPLGGATLLGTEDFANEEIGEFGGVFNLALGTGSWTAGSEGLFTDIFNNNDSVYLELRFAPDGSTLTETFSRMAVRASAYAIRAGRADVANEADSAFQFDSATDGTGYTPSAGMVYYDSDENTLKLYNGSAWVDVGAGSSGTSLFTDSGTYTYLTSTTDSLILGASTYTPIGSSTYSAHLTGLDTSSTPFAWDNTANRLVVDGATSQSGLTVYSNYDGADEWPLVSFKAEHSGFTSPVLEISQDGTGPAITSYYGSTKIFEVGTQLEGAVRKATVGIGVDTADERLDINGAIHIHDFTPSTTINRLYSVGGALYWNGAALSTGSSSLWSDGGTFSYLTSTSDDLVLGLNSITNAPFFFDVSEGAFVINGTGSGNIFTVNDELSDSSPFVIDANGNVGIGTSAPGAKLDIAGTSSTISNNNGDITITADESVVIKANDTSAENIMEWMDSTGGILAYVNSYGKLVLSAATISSAQLNLASSSGTDVSVPVSGDLWWNGTQLYFNDGTEDQDLLTGSGFIDGVVTSEILNGEDATAFAFNTLEAYSHPTSKLFSIMNNGAEKMYLDAEGNLYVAGTVISDKGLSVGLVNNTGGTVAERALVTLDTDNNNSFETTTTQNQEGVFGVVTGVDVNNDTDKDGNCDDGDTCIVAFEGVVEVTTISAASASRGDYIFSSTTAGSAMADSTQGNGLIGAVVDITNAASGYVKMVFDEQNRVNANLYLSVDKNLYHDVYRVMADDYNAAVLSGEYDEYQNVSEAIGFDTFADELKINSNTSTIALDPEKGRIGLWGGRKFDSTNVDTDGNKYLGASDANDTYYYDRSQTGDVNANQDSTPETLVDLGIDPYWYNGVSLETGCTHNCSQESSLSTSYNGGLFSVTGTYATASEHGSIDITIVGQGTSSITADIVSSDGNCTASGATLTFGEEYSFVAGSCSGSSIKITPQRSKYSYGDTFKIGSWYVEPATANDRGSKQEFPIRSYIIGTDDFVDIIDADTEKLWMRFTAGYTSWPNCSMIYGGSVAVFALNGKISSGQGGANGMNIVDFIQDSAVLKTSSNSFSWGSPGQTINNRNSYYDYVADGGDSLIDSNVNDVHTAVIPNHPTKEVTVSGWGYIQGDDTDTIEETVSLPYTFDSIQNIVVANAGVGDVGEVVSLEDCLGQGVTQGRTWGMEDISSSDFLVEAARTTGTFGSSYDYCYSWTATGTVSPRTYTAVATDGGVSVLNQSDRSVVDIYNTSEDEYYSKIYLTQDSLYFAFNIYSTANSWRFGALSHSHSIWHQGTSTFTEVDLSGNYGTSTATSTRIPLGISNWAEIRDFYVQEGQSSIDVGSNRIFLSTSGGIIIMDENQSRGTDTDGEKEFDCGIKTYTKDYISEEMIGDIRGVWGFNNNTSSDLDDLSVLGNDLTNNNSVTFTTSGVRGNAASFNGTNQYLSRADDSDFDLDASESLTLSAWVKTTSAGTSSILSRYGMTTGGSVNTNGLYNLRVVSSKLNFSIRDDTDSTNQVLNGITTIADDQWHHVVGVIDKSETSVSIYVDGKLESSATLTETGAYTFDDNFAIGAYDGYTGVESYYSGLIDEPFVTAEALTASQIKRMYQTGKRALEGSHSTNDYKNNLSNDGTGTGGTNISRAIGVDGNGYMYVGMDGSGADDGWVSKIDLSSDTQVDQYTTSTDIALADNDVKTIAVSPSGLELVGTDGVGVQSIPYDSNGNNSSGVYYSKKYEFSTNIDKGYLWMSAYKDSSDSSSDISVYASNDGGSNYVLGVLTNTSNKENIPEYEYMFDFAETGNEMIVKLVFSNSSTYHTPVYVEQWGIAHMDITTGGGNGLFTQQEDGVTDGGYVELVHGQNTYDMVVTGWVYDEDISKWVEIKDSETTVTHSSQEDWENGNVIGSASRISIEQESLREGSAFAYSTFVSPVIPTMGSSLYGNITWNEELNTFGDISIQTRGGSRDKTFLDFDGTDDYIDLGNPSELQITGDQTIEMWLKPNSFGTRQNPFAKAYGGEGTIVQESDGGLNYYYGTAGGNSSPYQTFGMSSDLTLGEWTHIAIVRDLTNMKLYWYINGTLDNQADATYAAAVVSSLNAYIGKGYVDNYAGSIDEVRIWNTARTQIEIQNNMNLALNGSETGLAGYWKLDSRNDTYAIDSSSSSNDGQIYGASWDGSYTWESWKPFTSSTNYTDLETSDDHNDWSETNADAHEGDITRSVEFFEDENETIVSNLSQVEGTTDDGYVESTISSTDISGYDYVTAWVRASQVGNTLKIGIGESTGNEQEEEITIDEADTWQKVYWDISDIVSTDRNGITKIRVTNQSSEYNLFYIDNIRAEKLLSDNKASKIKSTPNDYLQYRVIFTTTNLSYQPTLENITFTYGTGYRIEQTDSNTVRLYNGTGNTQKLRLDAVVGGAIIDMQGSQATVALSPSLAQVDYQNDRSSIWINKTGSSGNFLRFQSSGIDTFVVDSDGDMTTTGDIVTEGTLSLGSSGDQGSIRYNATDDVIEFSNDGSTWLTLGAATSKVVLSPEYGGAVLSADGTANIGFMTSDSDANSKNYYEWNSSEVSLNDYDTRVRFTLPSDFESWNTTALTLNLVTEDTGTNSKADIYLYLATSGTVDDSAVNGASSVGGTWTTISLQSADLDECNAANETCMLIIRMYSANDNYVRVGDIELNYNRSL